MLDKAEWSFLASNIEVKISGKKVIHNLGYNGTGVYYKLFGNDVEIYIYGLARKFSYSIRNDILSIFWKFYMDGKFTILCKKNTVFFFSNAPSNSIYHFVENVAHIAPQCLSPNLSTCNHLICKSNSSNTKSKWHKFSPSLPTNNNQKTTEIENAGHTKIGEYAQKIRLGNEGQKFSCTAALGNHSAILTNTISELPEDLIFYILSMLVSPIMIQRSGKSYMNYNSFYKDDLIKSTYLTFANNKLLKFFQNNAWEISINHVISEKLNSINNFKNLGSLLISNKYIKDSYFREFASSKRLPISINKLSINGNNYMTDSSLSLLLLRLKNLESLEIIDCNSITGNSSFRVIGAKSSIKYLRIGSKNKQNYSINNNSLECLFNLEHKGKATTSDLIHSGKFSILHLEVLNCISISKLPPLIKEYYCNFEYLDFRGCKSITNSEFEYLFGQMKNLKVLILSNTNINDQIIKIIAENCSELEILDISGCVSISEEMFYEIPSKLKLITGLKLSYCLNLRTNALLQILTCCKFLEIIDITGCCNLDFNQIEHQNIGIASNLRKIGVFRLSLDPKRLRVWMLKNMEKELNDKVDIEICNDKEFLISDFTFKYEKKRDQYLERGKPIWIK